MHWHCPSSATVMQSWECLRVRPRRPKLMTEYAVNAHTWVSLPGNSLAVTMLSTSFVRLLSPTWHPLKPEKWKRKQEIAPRSFPCFDYYLYISTGTPYGGNAHCLSPVHSNAETSFASAGHLLVIVFAQSNRKSPYVQYVTRSLIRLWSTSDKKIFSISALDVTKHSGLKKVWETTWPRTHIFFSMDTRITKGYSLTSQMAFSFFESHPMTLRWNLCAL